MKNELNWVVYLIKDYSSKPTNEIVNKKIVQSVRYRFYWNPKPKFG